jgi:hypothetical protein
MFCYISLSFNISEVELHLGQFYFFIVQYLSLLITYLAMPVFFTRNSDNANKLHESHIFLFLFLVYS